MSIKTIKEIDKEIKELLERKTALDEKFKDAFIKAVCEIAENENPNEIKRINKNCFIIRFSQVVGNPLTPSFYDWRASIDLIVETLEKKPKTEWISTLKEWAENANKTEHIYLTRKVTDDYGTIKTTTIAIDKRLINKIIDNII